MIEALLEGGNVAGMVMVNLGAWRIGLSYITGWEISHLLLTKGANGKYGGLQREPIWNHIGHKLVRFYGIFMMLCHTLTKESKLG